MKVCFKIVILFNLLILTACSNVSAVTHINEQFIVNTAPQEENVDLSINVDTILEYRDSFKEKETPTIEEIGVENLSSYLFQQFHSDLCYDIVNCLCHM